MTPALLDFDHVHVFVQDRAASEQWYAEVLGLERTEELAFWSAGGGPLTLQDPAGTVHIALFERPRQQTRSTVALRVSGRDFWAWRAHLKTVPGLEVIEEDHDVSVSLYFEDPDGNPYEITSYECRLARAEGDAMATSSPFPAEGGCDCRAVRYRIESAPLVVHCCHCRWCQRESGASFALNAMIEADRVTSIGVEPELIDTPSDSGAGQLIARCPSCKVAVWSNYAGAGPVIKFVRVGTLDNPESLPPDVHIFTASKQPWVRLPTGSLAFEAYYEREQVWSSSSLERRKALLPLIEAYRASKPSDA